MLKRINDKLYTYLDKQTRMFFTLKYDDRGVMYCGKAWYLHVVYQNCKNHIATFTVKDDGYGCYKKDLDGRLWNTSDVLPRANQMIQDIIG